MVQNMGLIFLVLENYWFVLIALFSTELIEFLQYESFKTLFTVDEPIQVKKITHFIPSTQNVTLIKHFLPSGTSFDHQTLV